MEYFLLVPGNGLRILCVLSYSVALRTHVCHTVASVTFLIYDHVVRRPIPRTSMRFLD